MPRNRDERLNIDGANPMRDFGPPPGPPPEMPPGGPQGVPPMGSDMMEPMDMPMDEMDMMGGAGPEGMPTSAVVITIQGGTVVLQDDTGQELTLPIDAFPIPPTEGMELVQATVIETTPEGVLVEIGPERITTNIPAEELRMEFNPGDLFWMPAPPMTAGQMGPGMDPGMPPGPPPGMPPDMMGM